MIRQMYPEEYACGRKIQEFILQTYGHRVSAEEISYLSVHIRRIRFSGSEDKI
ncbi:PRD domain-containing protein [Clostridium sp. OF09-36]